MSIIQTTGIITKVIDLSPTAREYTITPAVPFLFEAGAFVNIFLEDKEEVIRRAFSISSSSSDQSQFTLSIRHTPDGRLTPLLWDKDFTGQTIKLMGPLGLNTADKMRSKKTFLFGYGVGAGVVKSLADTFVRRQNQESLTIMTGNRTIEEILHKDYFDQLAKDNEKVSVTYVVSDKSQNIYPTGYIQENIAEYNFDNSDIYMCGQGVACQALEKAIRAKSPKNCIFFIEDFH